MNIYFLSQDDNNGYDTYDSCVVIAENEDAARNIHPSPYVKWGARSEWAYSPENVTVELVGKAKDGAVQGVVCASFNAG